MKRKTITPRRAGKPGGKKDNMSREKSTITNTIEKLKKSGIHIAAVMEGGHAVVSESDKLPNGIKVVGTFGTSHVIVK